MNPTPTNARLVFSALAEYGAPIGELNETTFADPKSFLVIGVAPNRIDILKSISGLEFDACWRSRKIYKLGEATANVLSLKDLIASKLAAGRPHDMIDVYKLRKALELEERQQATDEGSVPGSPEP